MRICIVANFAYPLMSGSKHGHAGGIERQVTMLARWLAQAGHTVSLVTWDEGYEDGTMIDGVTLRKMCRWKQGIRGLRFFAPRWTSLNRALQRADADVYYQNCAEVVTGQVAMWAKHNGRRFVYSVAADPEVDAALPSLSPLERFFFKRALRLADTVIVQTQKQLAAMRNNFTVQATQLPLPCLGPSDSVYRPPDLSQSPRVLWVGRISPEKRLELLLDAAQQNPHIQFDVAGQPDYQTEYTTSVVTRGRSLMNVTMHGRVLWENMPKLYQQASLLCSTSLYEGFPNVFLEAWSHGVPIVSTVDPDGVIEKFKMGIASPAENIAASIGKILQDSALWQECSRNARRYYRETHAAEQVLPRFEEIFLRAAGHDHAIGQSA